MKKKILNERMNVSELARFYSCTRNTAHDTINRACMEPDVNGKYSLWQFEQAVVEHCPKLREDGASDAGLLRRLIKASDYTVARSQLQSRGYRFDQAGICIEEEQPATAEGAANASAGGQQPQG